MGVVAKVTSPSTGHKLVEYGRKGAEKAKLLDAQIHPFPESAHGFAEAEREAGHSARVHSRVVRVDGVALPVWVVVVRKFR